MNLIKKIAIKILLLNNKIHLGRLRGLKAGKNTEVNGKIDIRADGAEIVIGNDCLISGHLALETPESRIIIGNNVFIGGGSIIDSACLIEIDDDVLISYQSVIQDSDNHSSRYSLRKNDNKNWKERMYHNWNITPKATFTGNKRIWVRITDFDGHRSESLEVGSWTVNQ